MKYLFVLAHPDDEADVGGTIWKLSRTGHDVAVAITVGKASARRNLSDKLAQEEETSMRMLGVKQVYHADFPNIKMNIVPQQQIVQFVEECISDWRAEAVVTHHGADVNIDHAITGQATMTAFKAIQSRHEDTPLRLLLLCETAGATEWALDLARDRFQPNYFVAIGEDGLDRKVKAHEVYEGVMRAYPHPQSYEVYRGLAAERGAQCNSDYAEAFQCVYRSE